VYVFPAEKIDVSISLWATGGPKMSAQASLATIANKTSPDQEAIHVE
jgi:hypothetical protein